MAVTLYHNPRCSKSRATKALLEDRDIDFATVEYLLTPPDASTLQAILDKLGMDAAALARTGESEFRAARAAFESMSEAERIAWLAANPKVIERPIVVTERAARIGRPPENVLDIL